VRSRVKGVWTRILSRPVYQKKKKKLAAGLSTHKENPFAAGPAVNKQALRRQSLNFYRRLSCESGGNWSLKPVIIRLHPELYVLNRLAASCSILLGNTEEEREGKIREMRKRDKERAATLSSVHVCEPHTYNKRINHALTRVLILL